MLNLKDEVVRMDDPDVGKNLQDLEYIERRGFILKSHLVEANEAGTTTDYSSGTGSENYHSNFSDSDSDDDGHVNHTGGLGTVRIINSRSDSESSNSGSDRDSESDNDSSGDENNDEGQVGGI